MRPRPFTMPLRTLVCLALGATIASCGGTSSPAAGDIATVAGYGVQPAITTVPAGDLDIAGKLLVCTDAGSPPDEFYNAQGQLAGHDIDTGLVIAARLRLTPQFIDSVFDTIILAVTTGKCDMIITGQTITNKRLKAVEMVPYFTGGDRLVVKAGNPSNINGVQDLCGKKVTTELGTVEADYLAKVSTDQCTSVGKPAMLLTLEPKATTSLQAVQTGLVDAGLMDSDLVSYITQTHPQDYLAVGGVINGTPQGISISYTKPGLITATRTVLDSMEKDGTLLKIMTNWNVQVKAIPPLDFRPPASSA